jgi:2-polyprenyl-3-methyl-5-hydroxy-6-metoxy-1,4-benzoquinol methylase/tetratricopeptide (TPR) repeat protein
MQSTIEQAVEALKAGQLAQAEALYRIILQDDLTHPDANHNLGVLAASVNKPADALPLLRTALEANPKQGQYWISYIDALIKDHQPETARLVLEQGKEMGLSGEQVDALSQQLALQSDEPESDKAQSPTFTQQRKKFSAKKEKKKSASSSQRNPGYAGGPSQVEIYALLGQYESGHYAVAEKLAVAMTQKYPSDQFGWKVLGAVFSALGKQQDAVMASQKAVDLVPNEAEARSNLGLVLHDLGRLAEAEASYRQAISLKPEYAKAHYNLGITLKDLARFGEAWNSVVASIRMKPTAEAKKSFVNVSRYLVPKSWDTAWSEMLISALIEPWDRPSNVMSVACRLLKLDAGFRSVLSHTNAYVTPSADVSLFDSFVANPLESSALLQAMLSSGHIADHDLERLFTRLRRHLLMQVTPNMSDELEDNDVPALYCYLAQQCFINEYVYFETTQELEHLQLLLGKLKTAIQREEKIPASLVIAVACYVPLYSVLGAQSLLQRDWPSDVASVLKQQIQEPLDELALRASIPSLTSTENTVSLEVQRMYEENPYPRWVRLPKETSAQTLNARLRSLFPSDAFRAVVDDRSPEILVAGCGTGQHPINTAQGSKGAKVLAIDLSMASLSYAKRKTAELGIENIEYAQADLLKLGSLGRTFDVIESSGVLHHLENPFEGWEVLLSLLKPHGLMRLGFYSEIARRDIVKVRGMIAKEGIGSSAQEIRAYRKHLLEVKDTDGFGFATSSSDFFSTSACRDLLFHVQEHRMTLPVLSNFFKENDLNFLGFEIDSSVTRSYKTRFPNDLSATDLSNWHIYEEENPDTFKSMYQFWIKKNT